MAAEIHKNDIGTVFEVAITDSNATAIDLTSATTKTIIFAKPDNTLLTKTATVYGSATNGIIRYTAIAGDLDQTGKWKLQAEITFPTGVWKSDIKSFKVYANL